MVTYDQLAQGLQKWVGWQEGGNSFGPNITQNGIARKWAAGKAGEEYRSSYDNDLGSLCTWTNVVNGTKGTTTNDPSKVHLLARIFLGSVCLIWSGFSQLGFLTGGIGKDRWEKGTLSSESDGLGSFMAAMGYDLERLNQEKGLGE
uniref:Variant erythrocyte surface antigen-1, beta subunit n=1 Tax=Babesia bovis TaxID=5865 RepID=A7AVZ0_BABBO|eukprot:XP_001608786.1 variant erythrocyte surface antigen-1, beta subunit [Babesia bovis T2Bo]